MIKYFEESANKYLELLEKNDKDDIDFNEENLTENLKQLKKNRRIKGNVRRYWKNGEISITDKDARHMGVSNNGTDIAHNVQIAVDSKNHLVVAVDVVSTPDDSAQLFSM